VQFCFKKSAYLHSRDLSQKSNQGWGEKLLRRDAGKDASPEKQKRCRCIQAKTHRGNNYMRFSAIFSAILHEMAAHGLSMSGHAVELPKYSGPPVPVSSAAINRRFFRVGAPAPTPFQICWSAGPGVRSIGLRQILFLDAERIKRIGAPLGIGPAQLLIAGEV
jgi:hypothetical protein